MFTDKFLLPDRPVRSAFLRFLAAVVFGRQFKEVESAEFVVVMSRDWYRGVIFGGNSSVRIWLSIYRLRNLF